MNNDQALQVSNDATWGGIEAVAFTVTPGGWGTYLPYLHCTVYLVVPVGVGRRGAGAGSFGLYTSLLIC